jgi:signal transduction histidine kinase
VLLFSGLIVAFAMVARASDAPNVRTVPLETAAGVLSLTGEQAGQRLPVSVTGVVTAAEPDWNGQFFVQDATGGVFVENISPQAPKPGDRIRVSGVSHPGAFAPIISEPKWEVLGAASLPEPKSVTIETLETGVEDGLRVEISGVVRRVRFEASRLNLDLAVGGYRLQVRVPVSSTSNSDTLIAARVRVRGTAATHYNAALRHLTTVAVYVPRPEDFILVEPEAVSPFTQPILPLNAVAQYRRDNGETKRLHVKGTVTLQRLGEDVFLQDSSGGLRIESSQIEPLLSGDQVEAVGFLEYENFLPVLRDAVLKKTASTESPIAARPVTIAEIRNGLHHAELITLRGRILDRSTRPVAREAAGFSGVVTTWLMQDAGFVFTVEREGLQEDATLMSLPPGGIVEVDGVGLAEVDTAGKAKNLKLLLSSPGGMRLIKRPSWWTPGRLLVGVSVLSAILLVVLGWLLTITKKNAVLNSTLRKLEQAQSELQEAHDTLEQKVEERSKQLQIEMSARKESELQSKAVLAERTRLARDLHDSLEQTLTGIALQLDTAAKLFDRTPETSHRHLQLARNWLRQSQVELRRSIWDLRSRELEQFDLPVALRQSAEHLVDGTAMTLQFSTRGERTRLPEIVEENVLRIGQEALTNVAKHARASRVTVEFDFSPAALALRISDDGVGFDQTTAPSGRENHFGLIGITERARRLGGDLTIESRPGSGTTIAVSIPLVPI